MRAIYHFYSLILFIFFSSFSAFAGSHHSNADPNKLGPYKIGHTTMVVTDLTRNPDGTPGATGRPLYLNILYPSSGGNGAITQYSGNSPLYDGSRAGFGQVIFSSAFPSPLGARENIPLAKEKFPLLIFSHGSGGYEVGNIATKEILASQGYIVVDIRHTGNETSSVAARGLGLPTPRLTGLNTMIQRTLDVRFVISQMLDQTANPKFKKSIIANKIGLFGFSLGGGTTMLTVAGLQSIGLAPDPRIKAAIAMDGTDYVGFTASDYANVSVPVMLFADGNDVNRFIFKDLVNSHPKFYADISAALHIPLGSNIELCHTVQKYLKVVDTQSSPSPEEVILNSFFAFDIYNPDQYASCSSAIYNGISDTTLTQLGGNLSELNQLKPLMPLRKEVSLNELERISTWYVVSFFNKILKNDDDYSRFLVDSKENQKKNPLVDFAKNCRQDSSVPVNIQNGDKITFSPNGNNYKVSYSSGNTLADKGNNNLNLGDDDQATINLPFYFSMFKGPLNNQIIVSSNGYIISPTTDLSEMKVMPLVYSGDSPWKNGGDFILNGLNTIAPMINDLDPSASGGVYVNTEPNRVIITYDAVPVYTSTADGAANTMQVIINNDGTIEMIYGDLANIGPEYQPTWIGATGITSKNAKAKDIISGMVDFASLNKIKNVNTSAIYKIFYEGAGGAACQNEGH